MRRLVLGLTWTRITEDYDLLTAKSLVSLTFQCALFSSTLYPKIGALKGDICVSERKLASGK